mgnify:CR=1 FL=1
MKRILLLFIGITFAYLAQAQTFTATTPVAIYSAPSGGTFGPVSVTNVPPVPLGPATVTFFYRGDLNSSGEYFDLFDENNNNLGRSNLANPQCNTTYASRSFTIAQTTVQGWAADGIITFSFNASTAVNGSSLCGTNASGAYVTISYGYSPATYDAAVFDLQPTSGNNVQTPLSQAQIAIFEATALAAGDSLITGVSVQLNITPGTYVDSFNVDTLFRQQDTTLAFGLPFIPTGVANYSAQAVVSMDQLDTLPLNDTSFYELIVSDSVMARDDSTVSSGIGNGTPIEFGHRFTVVASDTVSSVSYYLNTPTVGTSLKLKIYTFSDTAQNGNPAPHQLVDSSRTITVTSTTAGWYNAQIGCGGTVLTPGEYFVSVVQQNPNNMGLGYTTFQTVQDTFLYVNLQDTTQWRNAFDPGLNTLVQSITLLIRPNFGRQAEVNLLPDTAYYCAQSNTFLKPSGNWDKLDWGTGSTQDSISVASNAVFSLTVTDEIGCEFEDSLQVLQRAPIQYSATVNDASCGGSDGSVIASASGSLAPYSYAWDNGMMTDSIGGITGGSYEVTVTDSYGCEIAATNTVFGLNPVVAGSYSPPTCNGDADGSATVSVVDGIPSFTYAWQGGGSTTDQLSGLAAGTYTVTVTDSSNCSATINIDVINPDTLNVAFSNSTNPTNCGSNDGLAVASVSGGVSPYSYFWSNGQNQQNNINLSTGVYDVTVTDSLGCVRTGTVTLIDANAPSVAGVGSSVTCSEDLGSVSVTVVGGTAPFIFSWDNGSNDSNQTAVAVGTYNVNVVDAAGCIKVASAQVQGPDKMDVTFDITYGPAGDGDTDIDAVITGATSPYSAYQWYTVNGSFITPIAGETNAQYTDVVNGTYQIRVEDAQGCLDSAEVEIENLSVGIVENGFGNKLSVYPNPTNNSVNVVLSDMIGSDVQIQVTDASGRLVGSNEIENYQGQNLNFDLSNQAEGIYLIRVNADDKTAVSKVQLIR